MTFTEIDAEDCPTIKAFATLLKEAIEALPGHGSSIPAFVDSMIWGTMSDRAPPYTIRVTGRLNREVGAFAKELSEALETARLDRRTRKGVDAAAILLVGRGRSS